MRLRQTALRTNRRVCIGLPLRKPCEPNTSVTPVEVRAFQRQMKEDCRWCSLSTSGSAHSRFEETSGGS